jgi:HlyD family secretion protein
MRIADMNSIVVQVDVGENDIPKVKIGDTAVVEIDAYNNRKFKGLVYKIANPSSTTTSVSTSTDVTNYTVHIRLLLESYKDLIAPGKPFPFRPKMSASADIQTRTEKDVLSVPLNAVTTREAKAKDGKTNGTEEVVFILNKTAGTIKKVKVSTAIQDLNYIQIKEGLKDGDEVITGPYAAVSKILNDGSKVTVTTKDKVYDDKNTSDKKQ